MEVPGQGSGPVTVPPEPGNETPLPVEVSPSGAAQGNEDGRLRPGAKRVTFPSDEDIVSGAVEPKDPWRHVVGLTRPQWIFLRGAFFSSRGIGNPTCPHVTSEEQTFSVFWAQNVTVDEIMTAYKQACQKLNCKQIPKLLKQIQEFKDLAPRIDCLDLKESLLPLCAGGCLPKPTWETGNKSSHVAGMLPQRSRGKDGMVNVGQSVLPSWSDGVGGVPLNPGSSWQHLPLAEVLPRLSRFPNETHRVRCVSGWSLLQQDPAWLGGQKPSVGAAALGFNL
ncbi:uncharacterized protein LOC115337724 isoform X1 [Aquila chrysaetos chrysaetos]|uniref:uncharacterized protein LOC115337724 isoform X1 n=1 Tax=Aquila chrysaetos chrysaetos TaxID=223781 RepID=UPI001176F749|nr:uncharacterized protein LOC115337724 isoform X1 [Aquila chrysaetos chrysaetos]